jgi:hypothetical protein
MRTLTKYAIALAIAVFGLAVTFGYVPGLPGVVGGEGAYFADTGATPEPTIVAASAPVKQPTQPPPGNEEMPQPLGTPPAVTTVDSNYTFQDTNPDGTPVLFSPCRPIHYVIRATNQPAGGNQLIHDAVARVSQATGLVFIYDGPTPEGPTTDRRTYQPAIYGDRWAPVLFSWVTAAEMPQVATDLVGEATTYQLVRGNGYAHYVSGQVILDVNRMEELQVQYGDTVLGAVIKHEVAHLAGLGHTTGDTQLMYPTTRPGIVDFGPGDLTGLALAGAGTCAPDI